MIIRQHVPYLSALEMNIALVVKRCTNVSHLLCFNEPSCSADECQCELPDDVRNVLCKPQRQLAMVRVTR